MLTRIRVRARVVVGLGSLALALLVLAGPAHGQGTLDFERCPDPDESDWECGTHTGSPRRLMLAGARRHGSSAWSVSPACTSAACSATRSWRGRRRVLGSE
jgi:hypothetical protein